MLKNPHYDLIIPDNASPADALARTTHLAIGAHQDDLEIMAYHGIAACYQKEDLWFTGVTATDGASSSRSGPYADYSNEEMMAKRLEEQQEAAKIGRYSAQFQLGYSSSEVKSSPSKALQEDLKILLQNAQPDILYLHNPADKHDTHVALLAACIDALRSLEPQYYPKRVLGCEVWRDLDWLADDKKVPLDSSQYPKLAEKLLQVFDSQINGGKRYDLATLGRRRANATFFEPRGSDSQTATTFAIDLSPLLANDAPTLSEFTHSLISQFQKETTARINQFLHTTK
ncbi:PIG-L family deacetylase [Puniceicoccaceae bacterium K14]|nr:PIG-L family deacetylase [Puniceicoccaceae bacterium K14]